MTVMALSGTVVDIAASFQCSLFLLYSPCGVWITCDVWITYGWGVSALNFMTPQVHVPPLVTFTQIC